MLEETRKMFTFGYDSYMKYAFPQDELDPIHCKGKQIFRIFHNYSESYKNIKLYIVPVRIDD